VIQTLALLKKEPVVSYETALDIEELSRSNSFTFKTPTGIKALMTIKARN
jgi:hypothetical protein